MTSIRPWTRRTFVQTLSSISALGGIASAAPWASAATDRSLRPSGSPRFGFVASGDDSIHVFAISAKGAWTRTQIVPSPAPVALALSPDQRFLYAANAIDLFSHLSTGSVEAYAVDAGTGDLTLMNRQALALSATAPKHLAVSPDGRHLGVAVSGGAAYNLLPLKEDGSIGRVTASMKQIGIGAHPEHQARANPHALHFSGDSALVAADLGSDRISSFRVTSDGALQLEARLAAAPGNGPAHMAAHPRGGLFFIAGALDPLISSVRYEPGSAHPLQPIHQLQSHRGGEGITALAMHPSGTLLFASDPRGISVVRTNTSGELEPGGRQTEGLDAPVALAVSADGAYVFALNSGSGTLNRFNIDSEHAQLAHPVKLADIDKPLAIALRHR